MSDHKGEMLSSWYNYKTKDYDYLPSGSGANFTDEQAKQYISQNPAAQDLYALYRSAHGLSVLEAVIKVLKAQLGEGDEA